MQNNSVSNISELPAPSGYREPQGLSGKIRTFAIKVKEDEYLRKKIVTVCFLSLFTWLWVYMDTQSFADPDPVDGE